MEKYEKLIQEIKACTYCKEHLPLEPRPVFSFHPDAQILVVGQAPGTKVHETGIPWNDPSGDRLRLWMNIDKDTFYDAQKIAIVPMGFCYPGRGKTGDLPPRPECAELWNAKILAMLPNIKLTLLIGQYAQKHYLRDKQKATLTKTVQAWEEYLPKYIPLPHPSPRNNIWLKKNSWFEEDVLPYLEAKCKKFL